MRFNKFVLAVMLIPMLTAMSCSKSKEDMVILQVNDRPPITVAQFEDIYYKMDPRYLPDMNDPDGLQKYLDILINKEVMAVKAAQLGYDKDQFVQDGMNAFRAVGLHAGYLKVKVANRINVTEEDLQAAYENFGTTLQVKQILVDTMEEAEEVAALINEGNDFESVCRRYSKGPDAADGGQVVNALYGTFEPGFQEELFSTEVGDITDPILSRYGYFVVKVLKRTRAKGKTFEEARPDLEILCRNQQQIFYSAEMSNEVRDQYGFKWYDDGIGVFFESLPPDRPLTNPPDRETEVYPLLTFNPADLDRPMVEYDGKVMTIKDVSDLYDRASFFQRPRREYRWGGVKKFLLDLIMNELVIRVIEDSGIENEPEVAALLNRKQEQLMVDKLYQDLVEGQTEVPYQEVNQYYENNQEGFRRDEERKFGAILVGDRETAEEVAQKLRDGYDFNRACFEYSMEEVNRAAPCETGFITKAGNPEITDVGFELGRVGSVADPFSTSNGWLVLKYFERRPARVLSLQEAQSDIRRFLKHEKNEQRLDELITKWKTECDIKINEKNLNKADLNSPTRKRGTGVNFS